MCRSDKKRCGGMIAGGFARVFIMAFAVMFLWNVLITKLFGAPHLRYFEALGILVLSKLLFSGGPRGWKQRMRHRRGKWKEHLREKMEKMSPEERETFKDGFKEAFKAKWGKWEVNVWDVEVEEETEDKQDGASGDTPPKDGGEDPKPSDDTPSA